MRLEVLAGFDHRRQGHGVVQQQPAGRRLLREGHAGGLAVGACSERPFVSECTPREGPPADWEHQQAERSEPTASLALP